jgi:large repetitive protein
MNYWLEKAVRTFHRNQGYVFVELLVTIAITGIVMGTLAAGFSQFSSLSRTDSDKETAIRNVDMAGHWIVSDFESASTIPANINLSPGNGALSFSQSLSSPSDSSLRYFVDSTGHLKRTAGTNTTVIAENITSFNYSLTPCTVQITSTVWQATITRTYQLASHLTLVSVPLMITTSALPDGDKNVSYSQTLSALGGTPPYIWAITSGTLPPGFTLNSSTGLVSGNPSSTGTSNFTVKVTDSANPVATYLKSFSPTIYAAPVISTTSPLPAGLQNSAYSFSFQISGGTTQYNWSLASGALPSGLTLKADGGLTGTPTTAGTYTFSVTFTDSAGGTVAGSFSLTINGPLSVTTTSLPNGIVGIPYSAALTASGGIPPYSWSIFSGSLPGWAALNAGTISGSPNVTGTTGNLVFTVTDSASPTHSNAVSQSLSLTINSNTASFNPVNGPIGTVITVSGYGWAANEQINSATVGGVAATRSLTVNSSRTLSGTITVPSQVGGFKNIVITGAVSGAKTFNNAFKITPTASFSPTSGIAGASITVTGNGWAASENITSATIGGTSATNTLTINSSGTLSGKITVPASATPGVKNISITGFSSGLQIFSSAFIVNPVITVTRPGSYGYVYLNGTQISSFPSSKTITSGSSAAFTFTNQSSHKVTHVIVDGTDQGAISSYTFSNVTVNHTLEVDFN